MMTSTNRLALLSMLGALAAAPTAAQDTPMTFFVTSTGSGNGADLGGLEGADGHCNELAEAAGAGEADWKAYLSTEEDGERGISARDRIGEGPWHNAEGTLIAENVTELHLYNRTITGENALDENGKPVNGRGDSPNMHDILTGSQDDGTAFFPDEDDHTCSNWTSSDEGSSMVGHHDRHGGGNLSWTAAHPSRGCSQDGLASTGGAGLFYCFATN